MKNMCKGVEDANHGGCRQFTAAEKGVPVEDPVMCELCNSRAQLYCQADDAYLCRKCDKWVHGANFLAHRHIRCILCNVCQNLTQKYLMGTSTELLLPTIVTCSQPDNHCNNGSNLNECCSVMLKTPFLFLWNIETVLQISLSRSLSLFNLWFYSLQLRRKQTGEVLVCSLVHLPLENMFTNLLN